MLFYIRVVAILSLAAISAAYPTGAVIALEDNLDTGKVVGIVVGCIAATVIILAAARTIIGFIVAATTVCVMFVNWEKLCARRPTKTSKGVRELELRKSELNQPGTQTQNADHGASVAQSGGHPFIMKNTLDSGR